MDRQRPRGPGLVGEPLHQRTQLVGRYLEQRARTIELAPATPERADNAHEQLDRLIGPIVYRKEITQLRGEFLAELRPAIPVFVHFAGIDYEALVDHGAVIVDFRNATGEKGRTSDKVWKL